MCQASCGLVLARARVQVLQKKCNSDGSIEIYNSISARWPLTKSKKNKNYRECSNIKSARINALTGSVPRKMAEALQRVSALNRNGSHVAGLSAASLIHLAIGSYQLLKKTVYDSSYFATCNWFFGVQDCRTRIFQLEYQGQTRNTRILERKPLIDTSYCIRHRLEIFSLRTIFAQCSSSSSSNSKK